METAKDESDLLASYIRGSTTEDVISDLLIGLEIRRFKILSATNLLITLLEERNTVTT